MFSESIKYIVLSISENGIIKCIYCLLDVVSLSGIEAARSSNVQVLGLDDNDSHCKRDGNTNEANQPVFLDEISSVDASSNKDDGLLDNCGILPNNCLPCLASTIPSIEKRRSSSSSPPNSRKKAPIKLPFKWKEGHGNATLRELKILKIANFHLQSAQN